MLIPHTQTQRNRIKSIIVNFLLCSRVDDREETIQTETQTHTHSQTDSERRV